MTRARSATALLALLVGVACQRPTPGPDSAAEPSDEPAAEAEATTPSDDEPEPAAAGTTDGSALAGQASRPGGPANHDQCEWSGRWMGRFGADIPQVGDQVVTVHITTDNRWFVEADSMKTRGVYRRDGGVLVIRDELAIGDDAGCADAEGRYVFGQTNDCQTAALSLDEDPCEVRAARLHELVLERR